MSEPIDFRSARQRIRELEADLPDDYEICPKCGRTRDGAAGRIRELEAELAEVYEKGLSFVVLEEKWRDWKARAEKAERESKRLERILETDHDENCKWRVAEVGKLRARVAELEGHLGGLMDYIVSNGLRLPNWTKPIIEAREREAE